MRKASGAERAAVTALLCMPCEGAMADWSGVYLRAVTGAAPRAAAKGCAAFSASLPTRGSGRK